MKEFKLAENSLRTNGLMYGEMVECTYSDVDYFTVGNVYPVEWDPTFSCLCVIDDVGDMVSESNFAKFKPVTINVKQPDFQNALDYLDTFGIPAEITVTGMYLDGELTKVQWLDFAKILLEGEE